MTELEQQGKVVIGISLAVLVSILILATGIKSPTGFITFSERITESAEIGQSFPEDSFYRLSVNNTTSIRVTGSYTGTGSASIYAMLEGGRVLVYRTPEQRRDGGGGAITGFATLGEITPEDALIDANATNETNQTANAAEETISAEGIAEEIAIEADVSALSESGNETIDANATINAIIDLSENTTLNITENETTSVADDATSNETNAKPEEIPEEIIVPVSPEAITFRDECAESCSLQPQNLEGLDIEVSGGTLTIDSVQYERVIEIRAPDIPDIELGVGETRIIELSEYLEGDNFYDMSGSDGYSYEIDGSAVTIEAIATGEWLAKIYIVRDGVTYESNGFAILITEAAQLNETQTINVTGAMLNETNITLNTSKIDDEVLEEMQRAGSARVILVGKQGIRTLRVVEEKQAYEGEPMPEILKTENAEKIITEGELIAELPEVAAEEIAQSDTIGKAYIADVSELVEVEQESEYGKAVIVGQGSLAEISNLDYVERIVLDEPVSALTQESMNITKISAANSLGLNGSGTTVCVLDTGVDYSALGLTLNGTVFGTDVKNSDNDPADDHGHGTSVTYPLITAAPGIALHVVKVLDGTGQGYYSDILAGLDYCASVNASIISMSIGGSRYNGYCDEDIVAQKVNGLSGNGTLVVAAAGNDGNDLVRSPACASGALSVAASTKQDSISAISSYNNATLLVAPGESISTKTLGGADASATGTSMSVPFVSAGAALVMQNFTGNTTGLMELLVHTGDLINHSGRLFSRLNAFNAATRNITNNLTFGGMPTNGSYESNFTILATNVSSCIALANNTDYIMISDINYSSTGTYCFTCNNQQNISFDCDGKWIRGMSDPTNDFAFYLGQTTACENITVKNCQITNMTIGININDVQGLRADNITIVNSGTGIHQFWSAYYNDFRNIVMYNFTLSDGDGIYSVGGNSNFTNITIDSAGWGIYGGSATGENTYKNVTISNSVHEGINLTSSAGNYFEDVINEINYTGTNIKFGSTGAQNISSMRNKGWWPLLNSDGSDATIQANTSWYNGSYGGKNASGAANASLKYWYNNMGYSLTISFVAPTPANNTVSENTSYSFNVSITNASNLTAFKWNWNGINYSMIDDDLVLMLNLNNESALGENESKVMDSSKYGNNGNISGNLMWNSSGVYGGSYNFFDAGGCINIPDAPIINFTGSQPFTLSAWVNHQYNGGAQSIMLKGEPPQYGLYLDPAGYVNFQIFDSGGYNTASSDANLTAGTWYYVTGTTNGSLLLLYVDGVLQSTNDTYIGDTFWGHNLSIGTRYCLDFPFNGQMDEIRVWNKSLSEAEIRQQYRSNLNKYGMDKWQFVSTQSNLTPGTYTYYSHVNDYALGANQTETRYLTVNSSAQVYIAFADPTPANNTLSANTSYIFNVSMGNASNLNAFKWNWNGSNYSLYDTSSIFVSNFDNVSLLGENATRFADVSAYGNNGSCANDCPNFTSQGMYGGAYYFNGSNMMTFPDINVLEGISNMTVSIWLKTDSSATNGGVILDKEDSFSLQYGNVANTVSFYIINNPSFPVVNGIRLINDSQWHFITATWNNSNLSIYIDGVLDNSTSNAALATGSSTSNVTIGSCKGQASCNADGQNYTGYLDEPRIWNKSLNASEISQLYRSNLNKYGTDKWRFVSNQSNLTNGTYTYSAWVNDTVLGVNQTGTRYLTVNTSALQPSISFTSPTPANSTVSTNTTYIFNVSVSDSANLDSFIWNWNGTNYTIYNDSLILMLNFDNVSVFGETPSSNLSYDASKYGNNGTCNGMGAGCNWTSGKYGSAISFDGVDDYINLTNNTRYGFSSAQDYAVSVWVYVPSLPSAWNSIIQHARAAGTYWGLWISPSNTWVYGTGITNLDGGAVNTGWTHIMLTQNASENLRRIYVNSVAANSTASENANGIGDLLIGAESPLGDYLNGKVDEVLIWNRSLSAAEISQLYRSNLYKYDADKWRFVSNQSNLTNGTYTYYAHVNDYALGANQTETRYLIVGPPPPHTSVSFVSPTPPNNTMSQNTAHIFNASITSAVNLDSFIWNWNGTNYTFYNRSVLLMYNFNNVSALNENATSNFTYDASIYGNNGTCAGMGTGCNWTSGKYGTALSFDGVDDNLTTSFSTESEYTVSLWLYVESPETTTGWATIFMAADSSQGLQYVTTGGDIDTLDFYSNSAGDGLANATITRDEWHHVVVIQNSTDMEFYVDTIPYGIKSPRAAKTYTMIGNSPGFSEHWGGKIDEFTIWNWTMSAAEISQLYRSNLYKYDTDKWRFVSNQSNLTQGTYTYSAWVNDTILGVNQTGTRYLFIEFIRTVVGSPMSWVFNNSINNSSIIPSGNELSWTWRNYSANSGRRIKYGTVLDWTWVNE